MTRDPKPHGSAAQERIFVVLGLLVSLVLLLAHALLYEFLTDDAYISFRYARNLADGFGLVFNPGERVEGYTSLAWVLLLALAKQAGLSPVLASRLLGLLFGLGSFALLAVAPFPRATRSWAAVFLCLSLPVLFHFANGLETAAMAFLLTALFCCRRPWALAAVAASLVLTRPEGAVAVLLWIGVRRIGEPR